MGKFNIWKLGGKGGSSNTSRTESPPANPFASNAPSGQTSVETRSISSNLYNQREALDLVKNQVMVNYLYQQQANNGWRSNSEKMSEGVFLRISRDNYLSHPPELIETPLAAALRDLNVQVCGLFLQS